MVDGVNLNEVRGERWVDGVKLNGVRDRWMEKL